MHSCLLVLHKSPDRGTCVEMEIVWWYSKPKICRHFVLKGREWDGSITSFGRFLPMSELWSLISATYSVGYCGESKSFSLPIKGLATLCIRVSSKRGVYV
jgi:hypothetical protein